MSRIQAGDDAGLLESIVAAVPLDAQAIFVYALIAGCLWLIWWANRNSGRSRDAGRKSGTETDSRPGSETRPRDGAA